VPSTSQVPSSRWTALGSGWWRWLGLTAPDLQPSTVGTDRTALRPIVREAGHVRLDQLPLLLLTGTLATFQRQGKGSRGTAAFVAGRLSVLAPP